uniref:Uncharacterized protein n=1 Tax=Trichogramma kaykai TaxID=54128 RepID=A0ABD2VXR2_9HYME
MILSRILPAVSNIHSGQYDDGSAAGLPGFSIRTSLCRFQRAGKRPLPETRRTYTSTLNSTFSHADTTFFWRRATWRPSRKLAKVKSGERL